MIGRARTSTVVLIVLFLAVLALYLVVRPLFPRRPGRPRRTAQRGRATDTDPDPDAHAVPDDTAREPFAHADQPVADPSDRLADVTQPGTGQRIRPRQAAPPRLTPRPHRRHPAG